MSLEVGQHQHGIVIGNILAHEVFVNHFAARDRQLQVRALSVQQVNGKVPVPAVVFQQSQVLGGGVPGTFIGGVALDHRAADIIDDLLPEVRTEEILISLFTGVNLHGHLAGQFLANQLVQPQNGVRGNGAGKINRRFHSVSPCFLDCAGGTSLF